jgi:hypothetical protein
MRKIFESKREEVTGEWRRLNNEELYELYPSQNIEVIETRRMRWAAHMVHVRERRDAYKVLMRRPEGKRPLGRPRRRWESNIEMDLQDVGW